MHAGLDDVVVCRQALSCNTALRKLHLASCGMTNEGTRHFLTVRLCCGLIAMCSSLCSLLLGRVVFGYYQLIFVSSGLRLWLVWEGYKF